MKPQATQLSISKGTTYKNRQKTHLENQKGTNNCNAEIKKTSDTDIKILQWYSRSLINKRTDLKQKLEEESAMPVFKKHNYPQMTTYQELSDMLPIIIPDTRGKVDG
jgi:hypothetical protein